MNKWARKFVAGILASAVVNSRRVRRSERIMAKARVMGTTAIKTAPMTGAWQDPRPKGGHHGPLPADRSRHLVPAT